jgi:hypothetical protein
MQTCKPAAKPAIPGVILPTMGFFGMSGLTTRRPTGRADLDLWHPREDPWPMGPEVAEPEVARWREAAWGLELSEVVISSFEIAICNCNCIAFQVPKFQVVPS